MRHFRLVTVLLAVDNDQLAFHLETQCGTPGGNRAQYGCKRYRLGIGIGYSDTCRQDASASVEQL